MLHNDIRCLCSLSLYHMPCGHSLTDDQSRRPRSKLTIRPCCPPSLSTHILGQCSIPRPHRQRASGPSEATLPSRTHSKQLGIPLRTIRLLRSLAQGSQRQMSAAYHHQAVYLRPWPASRCAPPWVELGYNGSRDRCYYTSMHTGRISHVGVNF